MPTDLHVRRRLDSWKQIAAHLGRNERTAIRWEKKGLPVHRVPGGQRQAIFAYTDEIDAWLISQDGKAAVSDSSVEVLAGPHQERSEVLPILPVASETPTTPQESIVNRRSILRRPRFYAGVILALALAFLATIAVRRALPLHEHPAAAQPRVILRQSR